MSHHQKIIEWIRKRNESVSDFSLEPYTDIAETGYLDSMGFVGFVVFLDEMGAKNTDLLISDAGQYRTVNDIVKLCFE